MSTSTNLNLDHGFAVISSAANTETVAELTSAVEQLREQRTTFRRGSGVYAARNLLRDCPAVRQYAQSSEAKRHVQPYVRGEAFPVRAMLMDKTPGANWYVTWHQDKTIAVVDGAEVEGFGPWSTKEGVICVQPPPSILENMLALRLHLDDCQEEHGALQVIPDSHVNGVLSESDIEHLRAQQSPTVLPAKRGDVILMRPLLLHASSPCDKPDHRRVLHIEYAAESLPGGLVWAQV